VGKVFRGDFVNSALQAFRRSHLGVMLAIAALIGLLLSPFCDAYLPHVHDASTNVDTPSLYAAPAPSGASQELLASHSGGDEPCCAVVAERPKAVTAEILLFSGTSPDLAPAPGWYAGRGAPAPLRHWHRRSPGAPPVAALHARSAPLLI